jgi:flagellar P-ring protein precursor FlgI
MIPSYPNSRYALTSSLLLLGLVLPLSASRIKDITVVEGGRDNQLVGYGLVVGLAGDGDSNLSYTVQSVANALLRFGIEVPPETVQADNVAAVMVTADIGPFAKPGTRLDVTVSSVGDANALQGGILLQTPLLGADNEVYAVAQGAIAIGGFLGGGGGLGGASVQQNHPTVGTISGGAIVERAIRSELIERNALNLILLNPDFASAARMTEAVNRFFPESSLALDSATVNVRVPPAYHGQEVSFIAAVGMIEVMPDVTAKVIINERTGTIVATSNVRISEVAVSHGSLTITIANNLTISQPNPFAEEGATVVAPSTDVEVTEVSGGFQMVEDFPSLERVTSALNALGVSTREMMAILQAMRKAGALQAELILN